MSDLLQKMEQQPSEWTDIGALDFFGDEESVKMQPTKWDGIWRVNWYFGAWSQSAKDAIKKQGTWEKHLKMVEDLVRSVMGEGTFVYCDDEHGRQFGAWVTKGDPEWGGTAAWYGEDSANEMDGDRWK